MPAALDPDRPGEDVVEALVAECLARLSHGDADPLAALCAANPEHAPTLQRRLARLRSMGLLEKKTPVDSEQIGRFQVLRRIGEGGMGEVLLVQQLQPVRRLAALKVISGRRTDSKVLARFQSEQQALALLSHPNIAQVLEAGVTPRGQPFYVMEFVDGGPITAHCDEYRLDLDARLRLFLQLCAAVQYAHQQGILHRDLKPANVLVCERNGLPLVKVIDFGLAKALEVPLVEGSLLTEEGAILGTPEYMSPEQALPTPAGVDTRADVYALGAILYELCAGVLPFDFAQLRRQGFAALQDAVCRREPPPPSARLLALGESADAIAANASTNRAHLARRLRGDLDWITARALAKERERRYATVSELAADVQRHLDHQPVAAGPPSTIYLLRKFARRHRAGMTFAALGLAGLVTALVVALDLQAQATANLAQANENLDAFDDLKVGLDLDELGRRDDKELWPPVPDKVPAMDAWLAAAREIAGRLPVYRRHLERLEARGQRTDAGWSFAAPREGYLHDRLLPMVAAVEKLAAGGGRIVSVAARRDWAAMLQQRSLDDHAAEWREAIAVIADKEQCPYDGLKIVPQLGLVPLGRDADSRLYEFALLQPGCQLPVRKDGRLRIADDTCMVMVLIPGGNARIGLDPKDPRLPRGLDLSDAEYLVVGPEKQGPFQVRLDPYFICKYEMTQGQWTALWGRDSNPSQYRPDNTQLAITLAHPVESLRWDQAAETVRRLGLELPTGPQWELAARAGQESPWWCGFEQSAWHGAENLLDRSAKGSSIEPGMVLEEFDDGFPVHAPVDALGPNQLGLFHVLGNVREWGRDPYYRYSEALPRNGDGQMTLRPQLAGKRAVPNTREARGGSFHTDWGRARSTRRWAQAADSALNTSGLRPSRALAR